MHSCRDLWSDQLHHSTQTFPTQRFRPPHPACICQPWDKHFGFFLVQWCSERLSCLQNIPITQDHSSPWHRGTDRCWKHVWYYTLCVRTHPDTQKHFWESNIYKTDIFTAVWLNILLFQKEKEIHSWIHSYSRIDMNRTRTHINNTHMLHLWEYQTDVHASISLQHVHTLFTLEITGFICKHAH